MSARLLSLLLLVVSLAPAAARAVEVELGWASQVTWDSNPLRLDEDEESDFSLYGGPNLRVRERGRTLDLLAAYNLRYEQFIDLSSVNGFEHFANGLVTWRPSPRSELRAKHAFSRTRGLGATFLSPVAGIDPIDEVTELQIDRSPRIRNISSLSSTHRLSPRWSIENTLDADLFDPEDELRADSMSIRGGTQLLNALTPRLVAGAGVALTRNDFEDTERSIGTGTTIGEAFGVARFQISPTLNLFFSGGPAWSLPDDTPDSTFAPRNGVRQDPAEVARLVDPTRCVVPAPGVVPAGTVSLTSCPQRDVFFVPPGGGLQFAPSALIDTVAIDPRAFVLDKVDVLGEIEDPGGSLTFFGRIGIDKQWRTVSASAFYKRRTSTSSGINSSTNLDLATASVRWTPDRQRWSFDFRGTWTLQTAASEQAFSDILLDPNPVTVYVTPSGQIFDTPVTGATAIPNAARVVGARSFGLVDTGLETETVRFDLQASRHFTRNFVVNATAGWWRQESQDNFDDEARVVENLRFVLGFTWSLAPIEF